MIPTGREIIGRLVLLSGSVLLTLLCLELGCPLLQVPGLLVW